jgi:PAS domain S-box-containing protein
MKPVKSILPWKRSHLVMSRLEAFLSAVPGDYCGFAPDGTMAYSDGFCGALNLAHISSITDIQNALTPADAAALESVFTRLTEQGTSFSLTVQSEDLSRSFKLTAKRGISDDVQFDILWLEDITNFIAEKEQLAQRMRMAELERDRLRSSFDQLPLPLWMRDPKLQLLWVNKAYAQLMDSTVATVIAEQKELPFKVLKKTASQKVPGKVQAQAAIDEQQSQNLQAHINLQGKRRSMEVVENALPQNNGTFGLALDLTREDDLMAEHKREMATYNEMLEQLGSAIAVFNGQQKLEFYNSSFAQLWNLDDQYLNTQPRLGDLMEKLRETRRLPEQADFRKFKQSWLNWFTGLINPHEEMLYLPNARALRMLIVPHKMGGIMMTFEDVTSRLELESSYNTLIAVQKETLDNLTEGVAVYGGDGRLKLWNPAFATLWGLHPEDLDGQPHINRIVEKMRGKFPAETWEQRRAELISHSLDRRSRDGRIEYIGDRLIAYSTVPLPDGGVLVTQSDITDSARVENALREKNAALEEAERLKLEFIANVSYQLRTPLNAIMGFNEILSNEYFGSLNDRQKEYTLGTREASDRLLTLINNILDLSSIEAGHMELDVKDINIHEMLSNITDLTEDWARKDKIEVKLDCAIHIGLIQGDEPRLKQVILNLVQNAISNSREGSTIIVGAKETEKFIRLSVSDNGIGIPKDQLERIFDPFERVGNTTRNGAGLGLTLVKNIIEMHNGTVNIDSTEGIGTNVIISLPRQK